jgi:hypothetical protein
MTFARAVWRGQRVGTVTRVTAWTVHVSARPSPAAPKGRRRISACRPLLPGGFMSDIEDLCESLLGMPIDKAQELYGRSGWIIRCVKKDGREREAKSNVVPTRINVETVDGLITKVRNVA